MKTFKIFSIVVVAALLLAPATAMARTNFNVSLNMFQCLAPMLAPRPVVVAPMPPPPIYYYAPPRCYPCFQQRTIVKEYHHYHHVPVQPRPQFYPCP